MGREIRRVPMDWQHPRDDKGYLMPLHDQTVEQRRAVLAQYGETEFDPTLCRPEWPENAVMGYCVYEDTSEGTPISPIFEDEDQVIDWLVKIGCDYRAASAFVREGWCSAFSHVGNVTRDYDAGEVGS